MSRTINAADVAAAERAAEEAAKYADTVNLSLAPLDQNNATSAKIEAAREALEQAEANTVRAQERVNGLGEQRRELIAACASDPSRRDDLRALSAVLLEATDDLDIAKAAQEQADAAAATAVREVLHDRLAVVRERADVDAFMRDARERYIDWITKVEREASARWGSLVQRCNTHARLVQQERELCAVLKCPTTLYAYDAQTIRVVASVQIAEQRAVDKRQDDAIEHLFAAINAPFVDGGNGFKRMHPLLKDETQLDAARAILRTW